jgi:two-component system, NarL family, sensor histidine kinase UhpB
MSLRGQFLLSVVLALLLGFAAETAIACRQAENSVENEMRRALATGGRLVADALVSLPDMGRELYLTRLVRSFDGDRHIRLTLAAHGQVIAASRLAPPEPVPDWFVQLLSIPVETRTATASGGDVLVLDTDPHNEISESWGQLRDGVLALLMLCVLLLLLLNVAVARTVRPLKRLSAGFDALGGGDYAARVEASGPSEFAYLANAFNRMAERLGALEASNRRLSGQMLAIQEEERADLARDLHDEMGPLLFSVRVGAAGIAAMAPDSPTAVRARAIEEAATRMQVYVQEILRQLRPAEDEDIKIGLAQALENLALFWRKHHGDVEMRVTMNCKERGFGAEIDATIFRLVQEGVTNAVRHGGAKHIGVTLAAKGDRLLICVEDDGSGLSNEVSHVEGMGLRGMRDRLKLFSGSLSLNQRPGGGVSLVAELMCPSLIQNPQEPA